MNSEDPKSYNHPDRATLEAADSGHIAQALMALTREVWVLTDRMVVTEEVLARRGMDIRAEVDSFQPDEAFQERLNRMGECLVANVVGALAGTVSD